MSETVKTLDLKEAARILHMSASSLREKAKCGLIPGAKPGKKWVFVLSDLLEYLRSQYSKPNQAVIASSLSGRESCPSISVEKPGGYALPHQVEKEYAALLGLPIVKPRKNFTTS